MLEILKCIKNVCSLDIYYIKTICVLLCNNSLLLLIVIEHQVIMCIFIVLKFNVISLYYPSIFALKKY